MDSMREAPETLPPGDTETDVEMELEELASPLCLWDGLVERRHGMASLEAAFGPAEKWGAMEPRVDVSAFELDSVSCGGGPVRPEWLACLKGREDVVLDMLGRKRMTFGPAELAAALLAGRTELAERIATAMSGGDRAAGPGAFGSTVAKGQASVRNRRRRSTRETDGGRSGRHAPSGRLSALGAAIQWAVTSPETATGSAGEEHVRRALAMLSRMGTSASGVVSRRPGCSLTAVPHAILSATPAHLRTTARGVVMELLRAGAPVTGVENGLVAEGAVGACIRRRTAADLVIGAASKETLEAADEMGVTPLWLAVNHEYEEAAWMLLRRGVSQATATMPGETYGTSPMQAALRYAGDGMVAILTDALSESAASTGAATMLPRMTRADATAGMAAVFRYWANALGELAKMRVCAEVRLRSISEARGRLAVAIPLWAAKGAERRSTRGLEAGVLTRGTAVAPPDPKRHRSASS
jgi:hypothetical protein